MENFNNNHSHSQNTFPQPPLTNSQESFLLNEYFGINFDQPCLEYRPPATVKLPSTDDYPGLYKFDVQVNMTNPEKKYEFSQSLNKLFVNMDTNVFLTFHVNSPIIEPLFIRALPVYTDPQFFEDAVLRCNHHSIQTLECNKDFLYVNHIIRSTHDQAEYHGNDESKRLSVVVPLEQPQPGSISTTVVYKFVCKNSCSSGMNRRNTKIIFTLENASSDVLGRKSLAMRICSCPRRDKDKEEKSATPEPSLSNDSKKRKKTTKTDPPLINDLKRIKVEEVQRFQLICPDRDKANKLKQIADIFFGVGEVELRPLE